MPAAKEPKHASTRKQLRTIRKVLDKLKIEYRERYDQEDDYSFFDIGARNAGRVESCHLVHGPGLLSLHGRFGVRAPAQVARLTQFANIFNRVNRQGCLLVEEQGVIVYRDSVCYSRVKDLEPGYVAGLVAGFIDMIEVIDVPLISIAKGKSAEAAVNDVWVSAAPARYVFQKR